MSDTTGGHRLVGIDLARTAAIVGMLAVHLVPGVRAGSPTWSATVTGGRSAALFAVLAGVGLTLSTSSFRREAATAAGSGSGLWPAVAVSVLVRAALVGLVGLTLTALPSGLAIILPTYALLFVLAIPLLRLSTRWLVVLGVLVATLAPVASQLVRQVLPPRPGEQPTVLWLLRPVDLLVDLGVTGYYPALTWSTYLVAGLLLGRLRLGSTRTALRLLVVGTALAVLAWAVSALLLGPAGGQEALARAVVARAGDPARLPLRLTQTMYGTTPTDTWWWLAVRTQHSGTTPDLVATTGTALAAIGACLLLAEGVRRTAGRARSALGAALAALAAPGTMPLTVYTAQAVALSAGLRADPDGGASPVGAWLAYVGVTVLVATWWRVTVGRGPLETVVATSAAGIRDLVAGPYRSPAPRRAGRPG